MSRFVEAIERRFGRNSDDKRYSQLPMIAPRHRIGTWTTASSRGSEKLIINTEHGNLRVEYKHISSRGEILQDETIRRNGDGTFSLFLTEHNPFLKGGILEDVLSSAEGEQRINRYYQSYLDSKEPASTAR